MTREARLMGTYRCEPCGKNFGGTTDLARHMRCGIHVPIVKKPKAVYYCEHCQYTTNGSRDIKLHLKTAKHSKNTRKAMLVEIRNYTPS